MQLLISAEEIGLRLDEMAADLVRRIPADRELVVLVVMDGALMLAADLVRRIPHPVQLAFVKATSYREGIVPGQLEIGELPEVRNRDVLLLDDILDSGQTLKSLHAALSSKGPRSLSTAVLLRKDLGKSTFQADLVGFNVPDQFVVGYGMDWAGHLRHLPGVHVLDGDDLALTPAGLASVLAGRRRS
jgi:hypoxanthine phosphoribosyltransferase